MDMEQEDHNRGTAKKYNIIYHMDDNHPSIFEQDLML